MKEGFMLQSNRSKLNAIIGLILAIVTVVIIAAYVVLTKNSSKPDKISIEVSVDLIDQEKRDFKTVFVSYKKFTLEKDGYYKHCVGKTSPTTYQTFCDIKDGKLKVFHFIKEGSTNKEIDFCVYVNLEKADCKIGDNNGVFYQESELPSTLEKDE